MSECVSSKSLLGLIESSLQGDGDRIKIKKNIQSTLVEFQRGIKLPVSGPSYKLRYRYALNFWKEKTVDGKWLKLNEAKAFIEELKNELSCKEGLKFEGGVEEVILDKYFENEHITKSKYMSKTKLSGQRLVKSLANAKQRPTWYVTCKCEDIFYVIPAKNCQGETTEREIYVKNIPCPYDLLYPGDEVQVVPNTSLGDVYSVHILKYVYIMLAPAKCFDVVLINDIVRI